MVFAIAGNMIISTLAARDIISVPAYMQVGGISLLVSIVLFYVVSLMTTNRHPDATLAHLYGGPGAGTDPLAGVDPLDRGAAGAGARGTAPTTSAPSSSASTASSQAATTERPDHV